VPPSALYGAISALAAGGFPANQVKIFAYDDIAERNTRFDRPSFSGVLGRLPMGDTFVDLQQEWDWLVTGDSLLGVPVQNVDTAHRVAHILYTQGGYGVTNFGRWIVGALG
jgi:hypothetical protein